MIFNYPKGLIHNREEYLINLCKGKKVLHIGAAQANNDNNLETYKSFYNPKKSLHYKLSEISKECIGLDYNQISIDYLKKNYNINNIQFADVENIENLQKIKFQPDIIILGEILEHLINPGNALRNIKKTFLNENTTFIATVPNQFNIAAVIYSFLKKETQDIDHVASYTPQTIINLLKRAGLEVTDLNYYLLTFNNSNFINKYYSKKINSIKDIIMLILYNIVFRLTNVYSHGFIIKAVLSQSQK